MSRVRAMSPLMRASIMRPCPPFSLGIISEEERAADLAWVAMQWDELSAYAEEARRTHPHAQVLADAIAAEQPDWAASEECEVGVSEVAAALDKLGLKLVEL